MDKRSSVGQKRIGILGGSFNPPHLGHVGICEFVLSKQEVDQIWVLPCFEHPFDKSLVPFEHRFKMCELAFKKFGNKVKVLDIEKKLGGKSYTLRTIEYLKKEYPNFEFTWIMGSDAANEVDTWQDAQKLKKILPWVVVPRGPKSPVPDVSASSIRKSIGEAQDIGNALPPEIRHYIFSNKLY